MSETDATLNPEPGILTRVRSLRDLFPWLALGDSLGPATSFVATMLSFVALLLTEWGLTYLGLLPGGIEHIARLNFSERFTLPQGNFLESLQFLNYPLNARSATSVSLPQLMLQIGAQFGVWLVWTIPAFYVMRRTVLTVAGKVDMSTDATLRFGIRRVGAMLGAPLLLLIGISFVAVLYAVIGWLSRIQVLGVLAGLAFYPLAIAAGLLLAGLYVGLLLMWGAAATEEFADAFDIASRGFEYLIQRPLRTFMYFLMAVIISSIMIWIVSSVLGFANQIAISAIQWGSSQGNTGYLKWISKHILMAYSLNLTFSLSAVIYLLLRRDANHQEMEDVWEPNPGGRVKLPSLELDAHGVPIAPTKSSENSP